MQMPNNILKPYGPEQRQLGMKIQAISWFGHARVLRVLSESLKMGCDGE